MTTKSAGNGPPSSSNNRRFPLPISKVPPHVIHHTPRSWPRQTFVQPTTPLVSRNASEPATKKQKLNDTRPPSEAILSGETEGSAPHHAQDINRGDSNASISEASRSDREAEAHHPPPFPLRPGKNSRATVTQSNRPLAFERAVRKDNVPTKSYFPEPPPSAPRLHQAGPADFFPWTGQHQEDVLNELSTKQGFYDKSQASKDEANTAKPSMYASLKHKSGLQILSSLFVSALDQRQEHGTITANSTFKPPPRVTLTDTKREAWLRDLANPSIPLRRVSRTIPHGIRGKILLEHCVGKKIPTLRAIWLAKCVGANEIRAFKRKGTGGVFTVGGEAKWLKDWTTNVEQFLETIIGACDGPEWRAKIDYGLRLAFQLYSEQLLDRVQYLDWLVASVRDGDLDNLPLWLLISRVHQREILSRRQQGSRLTKALLEHSHKIKSPAYSEIYERVVHEIGVYLRFIISSAPACFLLPDCWIEHKGSIKEILRGDNSSLRACLQNLSDRNANLQRRSVRASRIPNLSPRQKFISLLDRLSVERDFGKTAGAGLRILKDRHLLITTCVEWSTSIYKHGNYRCYAAARLIRMWGQCGIEVQTPLLDFLSTISSPMALRKRDVYTLFGELIISKNLSVGKYFQWLMARGTLHGQQQPAPDGRLDIRLLLEIPLHGLPPHILNLRATLLLALGISRNHETKMISTIKAKLAHQIPGFFADNIPSFSEILDHDYSALSQTVRSDVARWIRQTLISRLQRRDGAFTESEQSCAHAGNPDGICPQVVSLVQFQGIRNFLEACGNFSILADMLNILSNETHGSVLTAVADTANYHFEVFDMIGAASQLFRNLCSQLEDLSGQGAVEEAFVESMIDLGRRLPETSRDVQKLRKELSNFAPRSLIAACSPVSDNMVEAVQTTEFAFADDMEQMLAAGTSIDSQTLTRIFISIMSHMEKTMLEQYTIVRTSQLLARLRRLDTSVFDSLFDDWLHNWLRLGSRPTISKLLPPMICSNVISLKGVLNAISEIIGLDNADNGLMHLTMEALDLMIEANRELMQVVEYRSYRMCLQLQRLMQTDPSLLLTTIHNVNKAGKAADPQYRSTAQHALESRSVQQLIKAVLLSQPDIASQHDWTLNTITHTTESTDCIIYIKGEEELSRLDFQTRIFELLGIVSDFNIPLVQREIIAVLTTATGGSEAATNAFSDIIIKQIVTCPSVTSLTGLLSELPIIQAASVRERAENEILSRTVDESAMKSDMPRLYCLASIIEATAFSIVAGSTTRFIEQISERLSLVETPPIPTEDPIAGHGLESMIACIELLLRLLIPHQTTIEHSRFPQNSLSKLLISLSLLLKSPSLAFQSSLQLRIFDVLAIFSDSLSGDTRVRCIHTLRDRYRFKDSRLQFIFGYDDIVENEWLQLVTKSSNATEGAVSTTMKPYELRRWEMMQDATPLATENDTSLSLSLFGARNSVL